MGTNTEKSTTNQVLMRVVIGCIFLCVIILILSFLENGKNPGNHLTETPTETQPVETETSIIEISPTFTEIVPTYTAVPPTTVPSPTIFPTSTEFFTLPISEVVVGDWRVKLGPCINITRKWVELVGVEITGGKLPYQVIIKQKEKTIHDENILSYKENNPNEILFTPEVLINTGSSVSVTIKSGTPDGNPIWNNDIYFPYFDLSCLKEEDE